MNEARVYADGFERSFAEVKDLLEFLAERGRNAKWIRKPTNTLRLAPLEKEAQNLDAADASMEEILEDTEKNTQLVLKMRGESYPVRDCAIRTILSRAGVNGDGLRKLDKATYAKVVNYCLRVAKGDALIKIADGKVSAVHGGDKHDYCILDMKAMFETTCEYLNLNFKGSVYMEGSGIYDHSIVSAMWKLGGSQELLDTYRKALDAHGMDEKILSPALRFTTSDVAASGANLYPMLLTDGPNGVISLGSPIKLAHDKGATILDFRKNLEQVCARYVDAMKNLTPPKTGQMLQGALQNLDTSLPVEELMKHMNYEMAVGTVIPGKGKYGGKTMGQVAVESPSTIQWFAEQYSGPNNLVPAAAKVILQKAMPMAG